MTVIVHNVVHVVGEGAVRFVSCSFAVPMVQLPLSEFLGCVFSLCLGKWDGGWGVMFFLCELFFYFYTIKCFKRAVCLYIVYFQLLYE